MTTLNKWHWVSDCVGFEDLTQWMNEKQITPYYCIWIETKKHFLVIWKKYE